MKSYLKSELADAAGVSMRTFSRWLSEHSEELCTMGVGRNAKLLPPKAVAWICDMYGIDIAG